MTPLISELGTRWRCVDLNFLEKENVSTLGGNRTLYLSMANCIYFSYLSFSEALPLYGYIEL
jgi:hypothetical protein